jgi:hypothetical protein
MPNRSLTYSQEEVESPLLNQSMQLSIVSGSDENTGLGLLAAQRRGTNDKVTKKPTRQVAVWEDFMLILLPYFCFL